MASTFFSVCRFFNAFRYVPSLDPGASFTCVSMLSTLIVLCVGFCLFFFSFPLHFCLATGWRLPFRLLHELITIFFNLSYSPMNVLSLPVFPLPYSGFSGASKRIAASQLRKKKLKASDKQRRRYSSRWFTKAMSHHHNFFASYTTTEKAMRYTNPK